jgi:dUTP pyrophosphatase
MGEITDQIDELKNLASSEFLTSETKDELELALKLMEESMGSTNGTNGKIKIKYINKSDNQNPVYAKVGDSGFDLRASLVEPVTLKPMQRKLIGTGLYFELPVGYDMEVRSRSGMSLKHGIIVLNTPGTIDLNFRGEIGVILINLGQEDFTINPGDRIAQGLIRLSTTDSNIDLVEVNEISKETDRGVNGFGHSGVK